VAVLLAWAIGVRVLDAGLAPAGVLQRQHSFWVPGAQQPWHWGFNSCNGFSTSALFLSVCFLGPPPVHGSVLLAAERSAYTEPCADPQA
jgi:hypothetical protein